MKNKVLSLVLGMVVILLSMSATSCARTDIQKNDVSTTLATSINAEASNALYTYEVAQSNDIIYSTVQDADVTVQDADVSVPADTDDNETLYMIIGSVLTILLSVISVLFKTKADRATNVINAISSALADRKVTTEEIKKIIYAWKGK